MTKGAVTVNSKGQGGDQGILVLCLPRSTQTKSKSVRLYPSIPNILTPNPVVYVRAVAGEGAGSTLAQKVGPLGVPAKKVNDDIIKASMEYKGLRIRVKLTVQNRVATIELLPSTACMIIKALKEPARDRKKEKNIKHHGNLTLETIIDIARKIRHKSLARDLVGTVKEVLGTCNSMGCSIDGVSPKAMTAKINAGEVTVPTK